MNPLRIFLLAALILVVVVEDVEAGADDDLEISDLDKPDNSPPPRENVEYDFIVEWLNSGSSDYDATVRLYSDCDQDDLADESDTITMGAGESDTVTLSITFDETGEVCYSATIYYDSSHYGEFENYINVEPETGDADLFVDFDMDSNSVAAGEEVDVVFEYGNDGVVSTQNPVTIMAYFDPIDEDTSNDFSNYMFYYISPPPPDAPPEAESMEWEYTIPSGTEDGMYKFTVIIDSDENNTEEDPDLDNNVDVWEVCVGDCTLPDLSVVTDSMDYNPSEPVAGTIVSFYYGIVNEGEGDAVVGTDEDLLMHLEVRKCPDGDCDGQPWFFVNQSKAVRSSIGAGDDFYNDDILGLNWSTTSDDAGFWNIRIIVDAEEVLEESDEDNNAEWTWYYYYGEYFELEAQRPDLIVTVIDEGTNKVYQDVGRTIKVGVSQSELGEVIAENAEVHIKIKDPDLTIIDWFKIDESKTVGFNGDTIFFNYTWTPTKIGVYELYAYVDKDDEILEWNEDNNQYESDKYIEVFEKFSDIQVTNIEITPLDDDGYAIVGLSSEITATIGNFGVRDMTGEEGTQLEVSFYTSQPTATKLATVNVDQALAVGESIDVSIPFKFSENAQYRVIAKVDEDKLIEEDEENNNELYKNIYAVSSMDAYVSNMSVFAGDGLAGRDHPITFDLGMVNLPDEGTYRLHFNISVDGTFGWGEVLALSNENTTGFYPVGTGYSVSGNYAYIDFNSSYNLQTVVMPWIPNKDRTDTYNISVEVSSVINVDETNDIAYVGISIEKLTTNLVVEAIKVTESDGSVTIKVTVHYLQGEQSELDADVALMVYRASDFEDGNPPIDQLTTKTITGILKGDSRHTSFTWIGVPGDYIFVAIVDPDDNVKEVNDDDNSYTSLTFSYFFKIYGCMNSSAINYNETANRDDGGCTYDTDGDGILDQDEVNGCTDKNAANYSSIATDDDDDSCKYAPIAIAGKDITVIEGEVVQFSGAGTDSDGTVVKYEWDFDGDGVFEWSSEENGISTFFYNDGGVYLTALRVTDNDGNTAVDNKTVTVIADITEGQQGRDEGESLLPSISLITSLISIVLLAIFRRK